MDPVIVVFSVACTPRVRAMNLALIFVVVHTADTRASWLALTGVDVFQSAFYHFTWAHRQHTRSFVSVHSAIVYIHIIAK